MKQFIWMNIWILLCALPGQNLEANNQIFWMAEGNLAADFNEDGSVGFHDFLLFVGGFNTKVGDRNFDVRLDLDENGIIGFSDFLSFSLLFGSQGQALPKMHKGYAVYVTDTNDSSVGVFDFNTHLFLDYIPFRQPNSVQVSKDNQAIYISEIYGFFAINVQHDLIFSVPTDDQGKIVLSPDGQFAYVTEQSGNCLRVVDLKAELTLDTIEVGNQPIALDITPDGKKLYVSNLISRDLTVVDVDRGQVIEKILIGARPGEIRITPDGLRAYVSNLDRGVISVLDLTVNKIVGAIQLDGSGSRGIGCSPDGKTLYISSQGSFLAVDVQHNLVTKTLQIADDSGVLGISPDGLRAYVGTFHRQGGGPGLTAIDLVNWKVLGRLRGFSFPTEIQFRMLLLPEETRDRQRKLSLTNILVKKEFVSKAF